MGHSRSYHVFGKVMPVVFGLLLGFPAGDSFGQVRFDVQEKQQLERLDQRKSRDTGASSAIQRTEPPPRFIVTPERAPSSTAPVPRQAPLASKKENERLDRIENDLKGLKLQLEQLTRLMEKMQSMKDKP
jgi:hypothetical protein